ARTLQSAGYATGHFGKWHMGGGRDVGDAPLITEYGFDESLTQFEGLGDRVLARLNKYDGSEPEKMALAVASEKLGRGDVEWMDRSQITGAFTGRAIDFIKEAEAAGKPFYVNLWPDDVHTPLFPPKELRGDETKRELYLGVLENMDRQLGELFDYIRKSETLSKNTIILIASDNGFEPGAGSAGELRGSKGTLFEGGIREPLIVWGPGVVSEQAAGVTNSRTVISAVDVAASLAKIAGATPPDSAALDGEDMSRSLLGVEQQMRDGPLFWSRPPDRHSHAGENLPDLAIREGKWKLLVEFDGGNVQLYDLAADPNERNNLVEEQPRVAQQMSARVLDWYESLPTDAKLAAASRRHFTNPIYEGADPWVVQHGGVYFACQSYGNRGITVHASKDLTKLGPKEVVWRAPNEGPFSREVWAPELHRLDGRWYIYFAASDGENRNHRTYVLESEGDDPFGPYELRGPVYTGDDPQQQRDNRWSIDATVLEHESGRYMLWSGWEGEADEQWLYIAPMKSPYELAGTRVKICDNDDYVWERVGENPDERGLHEAPQVLQHNGRTFVVYSTSSSWQPTYKLGLLELRRGGDPMNPADWKKYDKPAFEATEHTYGVGHASFVASPDGTEDWIVYHAKRDRDDGWRRAVFAQPYTWTENGLPNFGKPAIAGQPLPLPSGTA
ncbi:MAG TPA: family 43 glycosylhydrolase, partial [Lacipirellula sp.]